MTPTAILIIILLLIIIILSIILYLFFKKSNTKINKLKLEKESLIIARNELIKNFNNNKKVIKDKKKLIEKLDCQEVRNVKDFNKLLSSL